MTECPLCKTNAPPLLLGNWGKATALRCRACPYTWTVAMEEVSEEVLDELFDEENDGAH